MTKNSSINLKTNNVTLLVKKKDSYLYSRLTNINKSYSMLQAYPMLHWNKVNFETL